MMRTRAAFFFLISCLSLDIVLSYPWSASVKIQSNPKINNCSKNILHCGWQVCLIILGKGDDSERAKLLSTTIDPSKPKKGMKVNITIVIDLSESPV